MAYDYYDVVWYTFHPNELDDKEKFRLKRLKKREKRMHHSRDLKTDVTNDKVNRNDSNVCTVSRRERHYFSGLKSYLSIYEKRNTPFIYLYTISASRMP